MSIDNNFNSNKILDLFSNGMTVIHELKILWDVKYFAYSTYIIRNNVQIKHMYSLNNDRLAIIVIVNIS